MITQSQKVKWLEDLRSGEFAQTQGALCIKDKKGPRASLRQPVGFCCLGVLALQFHDITTRELAGTLQEFGLQDLMESRIEALLVQMNDGVKLGFPEIADWIEANVPAEPDEGVLVKRECSGVREPSGNQTEKQS